MSPTESSTYVTTPLEECERDHHTQRELWKLVPETSIRTEGAKLLDDVTFLGTLLSERPTTIATPSVSVLTLLL